MRSKFLVQCRASWSKLNHIWYSEDAEVCYPLCVIVFPACRSLFIIVSILLVMVCARSCSHLSWPLTVCDTLCNPSITVRDTLCNPSVTVCDGSCSPSITVCDWSMYSVTRLLRSVGGGGCKFLPLYTSTLSSRSCFTKYIQISLWARVVLDMISKAAFLRTLVYCEFVVDNDS